jgi:alpha-galactosidase
MFTRLGYFVTESSEHFSEYVPWFIKRDRPDLVEKYNIPLDEYIYRCEEQIAGWEGMRGAFEGPGAVEDGGRELAALEQAEQAQRELWLERMDRMIPEAAEAAREALARRDEARATEGLPRVRHSGEYASLIIHSMETGQPRVVYGNVSNEGLIDNLPAGCCVEVPCLADANGVQPVRVGALPPHLGGLIQTNVNVQALTVEAALTRKREHIYHAAMLDPHTAAELDLDQIWAMVYELIAAHGDWLPEYS